MTDLDPMFNAIIDRCLRRTIAFHPFFAEILDSATAGIFLSQLYYWRDKGSMEGGWIYKTSVEWKAETQLRRYEQEDARKRLIAMGILEEKRFGTYGKLHFRLDVPALYRAIYEYATRESSTETPSALADPRRDVCQSQKACSAITENKTDDPGKHVRRKRQSITESTVIEYDPNTTSETTTEREKANTPASPPPPASPSKKEKVVSDDEKAKELLRAFRAIRYPNDKPWLESEWQKYALSVRNLVKDGVTPEEYQEATAKALRKWPKREMVNPRSVAGQIAVLLEKKPAGRTMAEEFQAKSDEMNAWVSELYGTPARETHTRETHIAETFDPRGNANERD